MFFFEHHGMDTGGLYRLEHKFDSFPAHMHKACELIVLLEGGVEVQVGEARYGLERGELVFLLPNQIHGFTAEPGSDILIVLFSPELVGDFLEAYKGRVPQSNLLRAEELPDFEGAGTVWAQKSILYGLCGKLAAGGTMPAPDRSSTALNQRIFAYVDANYKGACTLNGLAEALQYDYAYLSRLFTKTTGMSFTRYVNQYRVAEACRLLENGRMAVQEVAAACGYGELRSFHRNFRAVMGCAPGEYRERRAG